MTSSDLVPGNEDVILACAFIADPVKRAEVLVLYAFLDTLRAIPLRVTEPLMGEIRLRWWFEAIEEIRDKKAVRYHPLTEALRDLISAHDLDPQVFLDMVEGQMPLLDRPLSLRTAIGVADSGEGTVLRCAAHVHGAGSDDAIPAVARFAGILSLRRSGLLPEDQIGETEFRHLRADVRKATQGLGDVLRPLVLPAALAGAEFGRQRPLGPLARRMTLLWAYVSGRV